MGSLWNMMGPSLNRDETPPVLPKSASRKLYDATGRELGTTETHDLWVSNLIVHNMITFRPMIRNAKDLSPGQKAAIESLLGRRVLEDEAISIRAIEPQGLPISGGKNRRRNCGNISPKWMPTVNRALPAT